MGPLHDGKLDSFDDNRVQDIAVMQGQKDS